MKNKFSIRSSIRLMFKLKSVLGRHHQAHYRSTSDAALQHWLKLHVCVILLIIIKLESRQNFNTQTHTVKWL